MTDSLPKLIQSARLGERGVAIVSRIINEQFLWLFKRTHQEHDYGIDGYIDIVTEDGHVTGQMFAAQIKCGKSFFQEKNKDGYVYRGERKHFNFLVNHPVPVAIIICHPDSEDCYWVWFTPEECEQTELAWKITVPFSNNLAKSKDSIESMLPEFTDGLEEQKKAAELAKVLTEISYIHYIIERDEVKRMDVSRPRSFFDDLRRTKELALAAQGMVEITFFGYESDHRELFDIPEVRTYIALLGTALPELFFFARTDHPTHTIKLFALSQTHIIGSTPHESGKLKTEYTTDGVGAFLTRHWSGLNEMTNWLGMSIEENKGISYAVGSCLGLDMYAAEADDSDGA